MGAVWGCADTVIREAPYVPTLALLGDAEVLEVVPAMLERLFRLQAHGSAIGRSARLVLGCRR